MWMALMGPTGSPLSNPYNDPVFILIQCPVFPVLTNRTVFFNEHYL
jgi:hypothetical protein